MTEQERTVGEVGEAALIGRIRDRYSPPAPPEVRLGIGDDAAVLAGDGDEVWLPTTDIQVQGVHFDLEWIPPHQLGRRAIAVNLSDVAAMGGRPVAALVSVAMPTAFPLTAFDDLFAGMRERLEGASAALVGGNLSTIAAGLVIDVFLLGKALADRVVTRTGAAPGDIVCVTGPLGASRAGLETLQRFGPDHPERLAPLVRAHLDPEPRVAEGQALARVPGVTAMTDISDGLAVDLGHLCAGSGVGAELMLTSLPAARGLEDPAAETGRAPWEYALWGGEDYELLFTLRDPAGDGLASLPVPAHPIGRILPAGQGLRVVGADGTLGPLETRGWDPFRPPPP